MTMAMRRSGTPNAFWDGTTTYNASTNPSGGVGVTASGLSKKVRIGRDMDQVAIYITNGTTAGVFTPLVAHSGALTAEGNEANEASPPADATFMPIFYAGATTAIATLSLASGATAVLMIPDWVAGWLVLRSAGGGGPITAGYEAVGQ
jgi:hypothetical protein